MILNRQVIKIRNNDIWSPFQKNKSFFELFTLLLEEATKDERLNFTTLFSRLAYTGAKFRLTSATLHFSHIYRKAHEQGIIRQETEILYVALGDLVCTRLLLEIFKIKQDKAALTPSKEVAEYFKKDIKKTIGFKSVIEAVLFEINEKNKTLHFYDESDPDTEKTAVYDVHDKNEQFNQNIDSLQKTFKLPIHINLLDVDIREDGFYIPLGIIIQPDHLVDVTSISECFKDFGAEPYLYLISKFKPNEATAPLMIGNLVNFMLDELISAPEVTFNTLLGKMFHTNPLGFALLDDISLKDMIIKLKEHFKNLQYAVLQEFKEFEISRENIFLEPSFYSRDYGVQGRLDLLHQKKDKSTYDIIELKSGKTFRPNIYGINASHYIQTLLYDLMIRSTFNTKTKSFSYILYSKENLKPLRFAPPVKAQQYEAMKIRNDIIAIEQKLRETDSDNSILSYIKAENFPKLKGFNIKDIENFNNIYSTLGTIEKTYFDHFCAFVAREHGLAKTGEHGINKSNGHAALWLESEEEKKDRFSILTGLTIINNLSTQEDAIITFQRKKNDQTLVNFRVGDIGVLYPSSTSDTSRIVLKNQIFKCTITQISSEKIEIRLRSKQYNQSLFTAGNKWNIEQDSLDSGFNSMYKSLFGWAAAPREYRNLLLGQMAPKSGPLRYDIQPDESLTNEQAELIKKIISVHDYFLLWGPPGTGKTSIMLKNLVQHLHEKTTENILLLAYTNRAVDEICDAVLSISPDFKDKFLRLGSRLATDPKYIDNLLDQKIKGTTSRQQILDLLSQNRIYISTVSSIINRVDLLQLKNFDTVIIDEASQILEPMLTGLLPKFRRFILIGDHKQLPAVVVQDKSDSRITDQTLNELGISDTRMSLFERLYARVIHNGWTNAYGILSQQGRMHEKLMEFPNQHFYEGKLRLLPGLSRQVKDVYFTKAHKTLSYLQKRTVFVQTPEDDDINWKTNIHEANKCVQIIKDLVSLFEANGKSLTNDSIGIITPYRAQIAMIKQCLDQSLTPEISEKITIDTVERYQGGARDIILISFCVNRISQLDSLVSLSQEGIDRKLNVALTRAKEQIILIGNKSLLAQNKVYGELISQYQQ